LMERGNYFRLVQRRRLARYRAQYQLRREQGLPPAKRPMYKDLRTKPFESRAYSEFEPGYEEYVRYRARAMGRRRERRETREQLRRRANGLLADYNGTDANAREFGRKFSRFWTIGSSPESMKDFFLNHVELWRKRINAYKVQREALEFNLKHKLFERLSESKLSKALARTRVELEAAEARLKEARELAASVGALYEVEQLAWVQKIGLTRNQRRQLMAGYRALGKRLAGRPAAEDEFTIRELMPSWARLCEVRIRELGTSKVAE